MATKDVRQINWRATAPTADLLDLAILVRQTVDNDPTFTVKKAAEEAIRSWAVDQLADHPDIAARSAVGLTLGAATATRDLPASSRTPSTRSSSSSSATHSTSVHRGGPNPALSARDRFR